MRKHARPEITQYVYDKAVDLLARSSMCVAWALGELKFVEADKLTDEVVLEHSTKIARRILKRQGRLPSEFKDRA